jgi:hypothetical protein
VTDPEDGVEERLAALEETVTELREDLWVVVHRDIPLLKGTVRAMVDAEIQSAEDFPEAGRAFGDRVATVEATVTELETRFDQLGDIGTDAPTKNAKYAAILTFARNKRNGSAKVTVSPEEIRGCVDVSRRYAYDLIDSMGAEIAGVRARQPDDGTAGSVSERKSKALLVDCEAVHESGQAVNQFTTGGEGAEES